MAENTPSTALVPYFMDYLQQYEYGIGEYAEFIDERMPSIDSGLTNDNLQRRIERMFKQSFPQSNGKPLIQYVMLSTGIKLMSAELGSSEQIIDTIDSIQLDPESLYPPTVHAGVEPHTLDERIHKIWEVFVDIAHNNDSMHDLQNNEELPDEIREWLAAYCETGMQGFLLAHAMCNADYDWLTRGRPGRKNDKAKYQSFFRTYILGKHPTGCKVLDLVNVLVRNTVEYMADHDNPAPDIYTARGFLMSYGLLERKWEELHGGQFAPPDIAKHFGKPLIQEGVEGSNWQLGTGSFLN